jgi:hypothetical protein
MLFSLRLMKRLLLLLLLWSYGTLVAAAQPQPSGPWRVESVRVSDDGDSTNSKGWRLETVLRKAAWDVSPDSIRLFLNCDNPLRAPGASRGIRFTATGATLRLDAKQGMLWVFATQPTVVLRAYRGKAPVFSHAFLAVAPPLPSPKVFMTGPDATICFGPPTQARPSMVLKAIPDPNFATFMPDEARYRVSKSRITLMRGDSIVVPPLVRSSANAGIEATEMLNAAKPGDQLKIEIQLLERMNARGKIETVALEKQFLIPYPR